MDLPDNLYESGGYYTWRHPGTKKRYGLGRDRQDAIGQAKEANAALCAPSRLTERISVPARTLRDYMGTYRAALDARTLAARTRYGRKRHLVAIEKALADVAIGPRPEEAAEITRRSALFLRGYADVGKRRMAKALRATLIDLYAAMAGDGWLTINPATVIKLEPAPVKRARLTLDDFWRIHEEAGKDDPWVQRSMELALVTLQRREDVARMSFRSVDSARLSVRQSKTGVRLRIPLELRLDTIGLSVGEVIARCRDAVVSPSLLHHTRHQGRAKPGRAVHPQTVGRAFTAARIRAGIAVEEGRTPPTFHELRSLGIRLYQQQGYDPQALAGHKDAATTAVYLDDRGSEWIDVGVAHG